MQSFETGYTLRPHVKYLIGSQNFTFFFGIDYRSLFNLLHTNPSIDEKILIEDIIRKFPLKYDSREILQQLTASQRKFIDTLSLSANDLSRYNQLLDAIEDLAHAFLNAPHKKRLYEIISAARAECKDVNFNGSHLGFIDLTHFCKRLLLFIGNNPTINQPIHKIISLAEGPGKLIAGNYTPTILCDVSTDGSALCPNGFSIFFPKNDADEDYIVYFLQNFYQPHVSGGILTSSYRDAAKWIEFVNDFHDLS